MDRTLEEIDIYDPARYGEGVPHEEFAHLRRESPVHRQAMPDGTWYWALLKHADVVEVSRRPTLFSAERGGVVLEDQPPEQLEQTKNMLLMMDPPRHTALRSSVYPQFRPRQIGRLEERIREICRRILAIGAERDEVEFVHDIAALLPSEVFGEMMGIPPADRPRINHWAELMTGGQDPEVNPDGYASGSNEGSVEMAIYGAQFAAERRGRELDDDADLGALLLATEIDGRPMDDVEFAYFFVQLVTAGNDTTRTMLSSGLLALIEHPDELARLRADRTLIPTAVEEILRFANPLHYFRRTVAEATEIRGQAIAAGDKLAMIYTSANRDEDVFVDPDRFDVGRSPNPHLAFGIGEHFCLGVHLARLEGRVFLEELLDAYSGFELAGPPRRQQSNLNNALKSLPVRITAA
ncbi:MAG TPA: cytochrome P450 [Acidimicrobiia bacterium]|nr:cytochrome P450 [Acidimicrobiia bacterium]